jgi:hypothetical protein
VDRDEVLGLLRGERLAVKDSAFDAKAFGSWWIEVVTDPPIRLVWEGKDHWAIVQTARRGPDSAKDLWEDRWIGRGPDQDPVEVVRRVMEQRAYAAPSTCR